jgi:hypothetical protein
MRFDIGEIEGNIIIDLNSIDEEWHCNSLRREF